MRFNIITFIGLVFVGVALIVYVSISSSYNTARVKSSLDPETTRFIVQYGISGFIGALGVLFIWLGVRYGARVAAQNKLNQHIMQTGIQTEGAVTFVDKNYSVLINKKPIFSIVEYTYKDKAGNQRSNRIDRLNSDEVIRKQIVVGSKIQIKYAAEDSSKSVILM